MKNSLVIVLAAVIAVWVATRLDFQRKVAGCGCPFCSEAILLKQAVFEEDGCYALLNYKPAVEGHMLIIPRRHVERFEDLTPAEAAGIQAMIARVEKAERQAFGSTGYVLLQKNGAEAGQSVPHVHFHYFPRKEGDSNAWLTIKIYTASYFKPLSEAELQAERLRIQRDGFRS
jgi:diadenosine tetraphosphate (Ap4A) HIT family hydrolase